MGKKGDEKGGRRGSGEERKLGEWEGERENGGVITTDLIPLPYLIVSSRYE